LSASMQHFHIKAQFSKSQLTPLSRLKNIIFITQTLISSSAAKLRL
jgi:hypothetical protein